MGDAVFTPAAPSVRFTDTDEEVSFTATGPRVTFTTGPVPAGDVDPADIATAVEDYLADNPVGEYAFIRVGLTLLDPADLGGSYAANEWTIAALSAFPTSGDLGRIAVLGTDPDDVSAASTGLFLHAGSGVFERVQTWSVADVGSWIVSATEVGAGAGSTVAWLHSSTGEVAYTLLPPGTSTELLAKLARFFPSTPVVPHLHRSKYITYDPDFPLDGTATHVGGQVLENGQKLTIADDSSGNGGIWDMSTSGPATRATAIGSVTSGDVGNYDLISYTGTVWAQETTWRLYGSVSVLDIEQVFKAEPHTRLFQPSLIATDLTGTTFTVLNRDGTTSSVTAASIGELCCVLVTDNRTLVTVTAAGSIVQTEDFSNAHESLWVSRGVGGDHAGTIVAYAGGAFTAVGGGSGGVPTSRTISAGTGLSGGGDLSADRTLAVSYGTTAGTAAQGNDSRLSDARTPTDGSVTNAKVATGAAIDVSKLANGTRGQALIAGASAPEWQIITPRLNVPMAAGDYVLLSTPYGTGNANATVAGAASSTEDQARYLPFHVGKRIGVNALVLEVQTGNAGGSAVIRMGIHANNAGRPGSVVVDAGTASAAAAVKELSFTEVFLDPGWYFAVFAFQNLDTAGTNPLIRAVSAMASPAPRATVPGSTATPGVTWGATVAGALAANPTVSAATTLIIPHIWLKVSTL